ncbi:MAG: SusC/RagA family TonB-linked outer membrane protein [Mangrovibacterium sp.]
MNFIRRFSVLLLLFGVALTSYANTQPDKATVKGTVIADDTKQPLPRVVVKLMDYSNEIIAVTSDIDGNFTIELPIKIGKLEFSFVGYTPLQIPFSGDDSSMEVKLKPDVTIVEQVMVVGYGTQKKENMTGAVDQIDAEVFADRPITNVAQGLQGAVAGLNLVPGDGKPTQSPSFNIRGNTSIGQGGDALVLIDGVQGNPALLNPNDIESVSVLKDASASAIYGARGAFGVVLITTKKPSKDKVSITYSTNYSIKSPTVLPDYVTDGYTFASMFNEAFSSWNNYASTPQNVNKTLDFSQEYLAELKIRSENPDMPKVELDPVTGKYVYYENTDWRKLLYKDATYSLDQNLTISSATEKSDFLFSAKYLTQPGLFRYNSDDYEMYNFRAKASTQLYPWLRIGTNNSFSNVNYHQPLNVMDGGNIWRSVAAEGHPMAPMLNPDGTLTMSGAYSVGDFYYGKNGTDNKDFEFRSTSNFVAAFFDKSLSVKGDFTYQYTASNDRRRRVQVPYSNSPGVIEYAGTNFNDYRVVNRNTNYITTNIYAEYTKSLNDRHNFKALAGYNFEISTWKRDGMERNGLLFEDAEDINLAVGESFVTAGGYERWAIAGGFFRVNYDFENRYLLEFNGRYDGSSKFPSNQRFAFFPSVSAGWNISSEPFWNVSDDLVSYLKLRASYGSLGNGNIASYMFQERLAIGTLNRVLDGKQPSYTSDPSVIPDGLTWETVTTSNIGLDLSMFKRRLTFTADAFIRNTSDMFTTGPELPGVFGAAEPKGNYADLRTQGWEISIGWHDRYTVASKPFNYSVKFNLADSRTKITKYNNPNKNLNDYYEGQYLGEIWGYETAGFFESYDDVRRSADQSLFSTTAQGVWRAGDIKFVDRNNDGVINNGSNRANDYGDLKVIGNSSPRYTWGLNLSADWNNFFVNAFFQGVGQQDWYPSKGASDFWGQYNAPYSDALQSHIGNTWTADNPDAYFPRYTGYLAWAAGGSLRTRQTRYLQNVSYIRMKNFQFGYNIPESLINRIGISRMQIYFSGENLWSWSPFYKNTDAMDVGSIYSSDSDLSTDNYGDGFNYPILKSVSFGLNVTF